MTSADRFQAELRATLSLAELLKKADECKVLYENAGMALPEPLQRFLGLLGAAENGHKPAAPERIIPPPRRPQVPPEAAPDWVWIGLENASPQNIVLAVLRAAEGSVRAKEVAERVQTISPKIPKGSVANVGTKLEGTGLIERSGGMWRLKDQASAGVIFDGQFWGPFSILGTYELAAYRRLAVLHLLRISREGLQASQINAQLRESAWLKTPINKDLLKVDLEVLSEDNKIKRRGNSGKWELAGGETND